MRLITYERGGARRLGAWVGETVVDLPEAVGHPAFPPTLEALVQHIGGSIMEAAHDVLHDEEIVDEFTVVRPRLLPALVPSNGPVTVLTDGGVVRTLGPRSFGAGLACVVGAARPRRMSRHEPRIFGYTLVAHWTESEEQAPTTSLGPCVVTPEHLRGGALELHLSIDGEPCGARTLEAPNEVFGARIADATQRGTLDAGDVVAWMAWTIGGRKRARTELPRAIELWADPIGVLSVKRPPK